MERLYNWMCWMISSSNRSVMVSKSAKVSIWKERDETGTKGAVATRPGSAHKPVFLHQASGHILGLCPCLTFGLQIRIQHQEKKPSTGAFQIGLTMGSLFLGETTGSTLQRKVVKIRSPKSVLLGQRQDWFLNVEILSGESISLSFPVSRGYLHSLAHDHLLLCQGQEHSIFKALWSPWPPPSGTLVIPLGVPGNPRLFF